MSKNRFLMNHIAICSNIPVFWNNKIQDEEHCAKYFGASWMPLFVQKAKKLKYKVVSGDIAIVMLKNKEVLPDDIYVIQELNAKHGKKLIAMGAKGAILTGAESPLFSYYFYDNLKKISQNFRYKKLFNGAYTLINQTQDDISNLQIYFPSYSLNDKKYNTDLTKREFMVMIAANKSGYPPFPKGLKNQVIWIVHFFYKHISLSFKIAQQSELHSKRIEIIKYFGKRNKLKLFGSAWKEYFRFQKEERAELKEVITKLNPTFVDDKVQELSKYKFVVCFENIAFDGYVTEKIIHCFIAGTIPIYLGAKDIKKFIPTNCFIDFRNFSTLEKLENYLDKLSNAKIKEYIKNGKKFLESENGKKYSYEVFAQDILNTIKSIDDNNR